LNGQVRGDAAGHLKVDAAQGHAGQQPDHGATRMSGKLSDLLEEIVRELNEIHTPDCFKAKVGDYLPNFVTARSGQERHFTKTAQGGVNMLAARLFSDRPAYREVIRVAEFSQLLKACVADLHAEEAFASNPADDRAWLGLVEAEARKRLDGIRLPFEHGFPARTLRLEENHPYQVGPVDIRSVKAWLDSVTLTERGLRYYGIDPTSDWKAELSALLEDGSSGVGSAAPTYLRSFVDALHGVDAVVSVAVLGLEQTYSEEVARLVARTALDGVSLLSGTSSRAFSQQALADERLQPLWLRSMIVFKGEHWLGGGPSSRALPSANAVLLRERVLGTERRFAALGDVVACLLDSRCHRHPQLATRWATALEWYAEGCRETSSSVAVTKLATALDVLTCGKMDYGITLMLTNLLGCAGSDTVFAGVPESLATIVRRIYGEGRSRLLHGTQVDRRLAFEAERSQAQALGALALVRLLERLATYHGKDDKDAFLSMLP
jgi:hypothetical protein